MTREVFVYEAIRTLRGRGRFDGSLAEVKPLHLVSRLLRELTNRLGVSGDDVDEIVLGTVNPHGEQGSGLARIAALAAGCDPTIMLAGSGPAVDQLLGKHGLGYDDIDLFEVNEAFAPVALRFLKHSGIDPKKMNPNGGAIALGHPLGATGAIFIGTVLDELERRRLQRGVVTLCATGRMAIATLIERV